MNVQNGRTSVLVLMLLSMTAVLFLLPSPAQAYDFYDYYYPEFDLAWGSYLGGQSSDEILDVAVDNAGNAFLVGYTTSSDFPAPTGSKGLTGFDAFVAKVNIDGKLQWVTHLPGYGCGIAADPNGCVWVVGATNDPKFPTPGGFDTGLNGFQDGFVAKFSPTGQLLWASFLGGSEWDTAYDVALIGGERVVVVGSTESPDFRLGTGIQTGAAPGATGAFIAELTQSGEFVRAGILPGDTWPNAVAASKDGDIWVTGYTMSHTFPTPGGFETVYLGGPEYGDAFVVRIFDGKLTFGSYIAFESSDWDELGCGVALDSLNNAWVVGTTLTAPDPEGFYESYGFALKITPQGWLDYLDLCPDATSQYLGVAVDQYNRAWITGNAGPDYLTNGFNTTCGGDTDSIVAIIGIGFDPETGQLITTTIWSSFVGTWGYSYLTGIAMDKDWNVWLAGLSYEGLPTPGGFGKYYCGDTDGAVARLVPANGLLFSTLNPVDGHSVLIDTPHAFSYSGDTSVRDAHIIFYTHADPGRVMLAGNGAPVNKTVSFSVVTGAPLWQPTDAEWRSIKRVADLDGKVTWCLEGKLARRGQVFSVPQSITFLAGNVSNLSVAQDSSPGGGLVSPLAGDPPTFAWHDATTGMKYFHLDFSVDEAMPMGAGQSFVVAVPANVPPGSFRLTAAQWRKVRFLATAGGGTLYWRVRATSTDKSLTIGSDVASFQVSGGNWSISDLDLSGFPEVTWNYGGQGLVNCALQISAADTFDALPAKTLTLSVHPISDGSYVLTANDLRRAKALAANNVVSTLHYRLRGTDADNAFVGYSEAKTTSVP